MFKGIPFHEGDGRALRLHSWSGRGRGPLSRPTPAASPKAVDVTMREMVTRAEQQALRLRPGQHVSVTIERLVFQGDGLGRLPDGRVIFVPLTAPGDEVEVRVVEDRGHFARGAAVDIRLASPLRVEPPCRHFG